MESYRELMALTGRVLDAVGVCVIVFGPVIATLRFAARSTGGDRYRTYRQDRGRAILLGLEF